MRVLFILWAAGAFDEDKRPPTPPQDLGIQLCSVYAVYMLMVFIFYAFGVLEEATRNAKN